MSDTQIGPGRELDALVAEKVMGLVWDESRCRICGWPLEPWDGTGEIPTGCVLESCSQRPAPSTRADVPAKYSTSIGIVWLVVEKMQCHPTTTSRTLRMVVYPYSRTYATFDWDEDSDDWAEANGEHATPTAICLAALRVAETQSP